MCFFQKIKIHIIKHQVHSVECSRRRGKKLGKIESINRNIERNLKREKNCKFHTLYKRCGGSANSPGSPHQWFIKFHETSKFHNFLTFQPIFMNLLLYCLLNFTLIIQINLKMVRTFPLLSIPATDLSEFIDSLQHPLHLLLLLLRQTELKQLQFIPLKSNKFAIRLLHFLQYNLPNL